jgi:hypothetical protein
VKRESPRGRLSTPLSKRYLNLVAAEAYTKPIAAHGWDIAGALAAAISDQRDVIGENLVEVAEEITESAGR